LSKPVASCGLGKLYSKEALLRYLVDRTSYGDGDKICSHIRSGKDVVTLNLTDNPAYNAKAIKEKNATAGDFEQEPMAKFICPISMKEMNGKQRFLYLDSCGCAFAEQSLKEVPSKECVNVNIHIRIKSDCFCFCVYCLFSMPSMTYCKREN
jgi:hypothetical protein